MAGGAVLRGHASWPLDVLFTHYALEFAAGMGMARVLAMGWRARAPWLLLLAGALLFVAAGLNEALLGRVATSWTQAMASAAMVAGAATLDLKGPVGWPRPLTALGDASYALYLTHYPALSATAKALVAVGAAAIVPAGALWCVILVLVVGGGVVFHWVLERRLLGLGAPIAPRAPATA